MAEAIISLREKNKLMPCDIGHSDHSFADVKIISKAIKDLGGVEAILQTLEGEDIRGKKALEITIELAKKAGWLATMFLKNPLRWKSLFSKFPVTLLRARSWLLN
mgnify:CR=1 FL=1